MAVFDLHPPPVQENASAPSAGQALWLKGDVSDETDVREAARRITVEFGSLDVLINNVGIELNGTVLEQSVEHWDRQIAVNLRSAFLFSKHCIPLMKGRSGAAIVNISSCHAFVSWPGCAAYDASKAGLLGLTRALAVDHGAGGIRVNAICPGYIRTPLLAQWFASGEGTEEQARQLHPLGRLGEPSDVASAAFFLASGEASFMTGAILTVDGGVTACGR